ncbi:hypothetical protein MRX96_004856 [Rhipicephalus microplus]
MIHVGAEMSRAEPDDFSVVPERSPFAEGHPHPLLNGKREPSSGAENKTGKTSDAATVGSERKGKCSVGLQREAGSGAGKAYPKE